jgi:colicin import membrane protein
MASLKKKRHANIDESYQKKRPAKDFFSKFIFISIIAHTLLVSVFIIKTVLIPDEALDYESAIRVDIVALPDKVTKNEPATEPAPISQPQPEKAIEKLVEKEVKTLPPKEKPEPEAIKLTKDNSKEKSDASEINTKQKEAIAKLKALSAIEEFKKEATEAKNLEKENNAKKAAQLIKGNILAPGTAISGLSKIQHENYISEIDRHVKKNWTLPQWLTQKNLKARALVKIDNLGNIIEKKIVKSSGNSSYDEAILDTIAQSSPFPKPPEKFSNLVSVDGILLGFPE